MIHAFAVDAVVSPNVSLLAFPAAWAWPFRPPGPCSSTLRLNEPLDGVPYGASLHCLHAVPLRAQRAQMPHTLCAMHRLIETIPPAGEAARPSFDCPTHRVQTRREGHHRVPNILCLTNHLQVSVAKRLSLA
eukprot:scaffold1122_cov377-Prasinococcus_capsulatus_cf.AAC.12